MRLRLALLTNNECFKEASRMPKGVMIHSTGANNPKVSRYVPGDDVIGLNTGGNHWDKPGVKKCVHAFIGKFADGGVGTAQTLPWTTRGWHCGGKANDTHIGFEICEDGLEDKEYFSAVYREAVELTAHLCTIWQLDPLKDGVVICHSEGRKRGWATNHADVMHWFPKHGKTMDDFRADVALEMEDKVTQEKFDEMMGNWMARKAKLPESPWSKMKQAKENGLTDGSRPQSFATREEVATMIVNAMKK